MASVIIIIKSRSKNAVRMIMHACEWMILHNRRIRRQTAICLMMTTCTRYNVYLTLLGPQSSFGDNWGHMTWNLSVVSPKRDCGSKRVASTHYFQVKTSTRYLINNKRRDERQDLVGSSPSQAGSRMPDEPTHRRTDKLTRLRHAVPNLLFFFCASVCSLLCARLWPKFWSSM